MPLAPGNIQSMTTTAGIGPSSNCKRFFGAAGADGVEAGAIQRERQHLANLGLVFDEHDGLGCHCVRPSMIAVRASAVRILTGDRLRIDSPSTRDYHAPHSVGGRTLWIYDTPLRPKRTAHGRVADALYRLLPEIKCPVEESMGQTKQLRAIDGFAFGTYEAMPSAKPRGGIVVIQEIFGVNSHIRNVCDGYAAAGYAAIAPQIFDRVERNVELGYEQKDMTRGVEIARGKLKMEQTLQDLQAAVDDAKRFGKVGVVGYCFGGLLSWLSACDLNGVSAAVSYYGGGVASQLDRKPRCPVMMHFGDKGRAHSAERRRQGPQGAPRRDRPRLRSGSRLQLRPPRAATTRRRQSSR